MNSIYKVIWSKAKNCYVVASEIAKSHTKSASGQSVRRSALASLLALSFLCGGLGVAEASVHVNENTGGAYEVLTKQEVTEELNKKVSTEVADLKYATKDALNDLTTTVNGKADKTYVDNAINAAEGKIDANTTAIGDLKAKDTELEGKITTLDENGVKYDTAVKDKITLAGAGGTTITNLKDAALNDSSTEAVTGKQLNQTNERTAGIEYDKARDETTIGGQVTVNSIGDVTARGQLTAKGGVNAGNSDITTTGEVNAGSLNVENASHLKGDVTMDKGLTVTSGDTTLKGTKVDGKLTVTDDADLKNTKVDGTLGVTGDTTLEGALTAKGNVTVEKDLTVDGKLNVGEIYLENNKLESTGKKHDSATSITADGISNLAKVTELGHTTESQFTHNEKGTFNHAKDGNTTDWKESTSNVTADGVENIAKDSKGNNNTFTQTSTDTKNTLTDKEGNTSSTRQDSKGIYGYAKDKDGNKSYTKQEGNRIAESVIGQDGKETKSEMTSTDITNTAKDGTITSDAKDIVNKATGNISNSSATMDTTVTGKATESYGELETEVKGNEKHTVKGDQTNEVDGKQINTIKNGQENIISGGQTNTITGGQINNITGDQTTNVSGTQTTTATDINRNASSSMVDKVDNAYGTNTETKEAGKTTTDVSIKGTGEKGQYIRGANESRDYLIKGTLTNTETKTAEATSSEITDGTNTASTRQDAKNLAGSVTNGTETGVSGIHANDNGSVSIDSAVIDVTDGNKYSVINQKKGSIQSTVVDGTNSTVILQDTDNVTIASSNGTVAIAGKDIVNNASESITNKAKTMDTTVTGKATESYGELETTVTGQATENFNGGLNTKVTGAENHTVTGKQTNTVEGGQENIISGGQTNTITGGQINNITGDQTTTITGKKTETVTENVTEDYKKNLTTTVGGNEIHEVKGTKTETVEGKVTEKFNNGQETTVTGDQDIHVTKNQTNEIGGNQENTIGGDQITNVTGDISNTAKNITNAATDTLTDKVGTNTRVINSRSITDTVGRANRMIEDGKITDNAGDFTVTTDKENGTTFTNAGSTASSFTTVDGTNTGSAQEWTNIKGNEISTGKVEANYVKMDYADVMYDLGVHGSATVDNDLTVKGITTTKTLKVTENATVGGTLDVTKKATFHDDVDITKNLSVGGNATITGDVTANSYKVGDKTYISADGINANNQKITNVADGSISEGSKDAVNGGQLYGVKRDLEHQVDKVGANAAAMANLRPMEFDPSSKWNIAAAIGNYGSETAAAIGAFYRPNDNVMVNLSTAFGTGENMVGGGVSVRLGKGGNKLSREETNALKAQVADLTARMDALLSVLNPNMSKDFPDVPENHWAYEAVSRLAGNDIVQGYPDGEFHGERTMTRYEMAEIIYNALSRGAEAERKLVEEFKPELQAMAASEKATAEKAEG